MALEDQFCAQTYSPLPFVISRAEGIMTWSPEGTQRMDFLSAFSAVNQGHCHPVRQSQYPSSGQWAPSFLNTTHPRTHTRARRKLWRPW